MSTLTTRIEAALPGLRIAEQRMARHFLRHPQDTILGSAAQIAERLGTSDATVVRTARALGYDSLADLRAAFVEDLMTPSPAERLARTLKAAKRAKGGALEHVLTVHQDSLNAFDDPAFAKSFGDALSALAKSPAQHVFGVGPSGALADYAALQFNRIGLRSTSLNATGIALADRMLALRPRDAVMIIAYAPLYREVRVTLERARQVGTRIVLVSDSLGALVDAPLDAILPVPRGKAGHLATHGATMVLLDAMVAGLAERQGPSALRALSDFADLRGKLDRSWKRRGTRQTAKGEPR